MAGSGGVAAPILVVMRFCVSVLGVVALTGSARADDEVEPPPVEIHGFVSQGLLKSTDNNFLADSERGSFEFSEFGINFSRALTEQLRVGMQLFARDLGPVGNYSAKIDWAYLDYRYRDWLGFRAGRIKLPFGLYNEISDIDAAHPFALLPQSVYPTNNRDFLLAQTGVELYGFKRFEESGALEYRLYGGTIFLDTSATPMTGPFVLQRLSIPYVVGGRIAYETPLEGLRVAASVQRLRLETDFLDNRDPMMPGKMLSADIPATLTTFSAEYNHEDIWFAAEYSRWYTDVETDDPLFEQPQSVSVRGYAFAAYRVRPWLMPGAYYAVMYPQLDGRDKQSGKQHDAAGTVRLDINSNWILKLELHHMRGTAGLSTNLNPGETLDTLDNRWLLFVAKTTVFF